MSIGYSMFAKHGRAEIAVHRFNEDNAMVGMSSLEMVGGGDAPVVSRIGGDIELMREGVKLYASAEIQGWVEAAIKARDEAKAEASQLPAAPEVK